MSRGTALGQMAVESDNAKFEMQCSLSIKKKRLLPKIGTPDYGRKLTERLLTKLLGELPRVKTRVSGTKIYGHGPNDDRWPCSKVSFSLEQVSKPDFPEREDEIRCFITCRNEARRLPWLLTYYRGLGVDRFFVIDNGSTDGSEDFLSSQSDVHHFVTNDDYAAHRHGVNWLQALLQIHGSGHWCLSIDADEMLVFPGCEEMSLKDLRDFMEREKADALFTMMIDMYQDPHGTRRGYKIGESFLSTSDTFDLGPYHVLIRENHMFPHIKIKGGFQHRLLQQQDQNMKGPPIVKVPFVKWTPGHFYVSSTHGITPAVKLSTVTGALLHFKYLFSEEMSFENEFAESRRSPGERERIAALREIFENEPQKDFTTSQSATYESSLKLSRLGFLNCPKSFMDFVRQDDSKSQKTRASSDFNEIADPSTLRPRGLAAILCQHIL